MDRPTSMDTHGHQGIVDNLIVPHRSLSGFAGIKTDSSRFVMMAVIAD
jgi:hypothetical protein